MHSQALVGILLEGGIIAGQGTGPKLKDTDQSVTLVLLSWRAVEIVGRSNDAAEDPPLMRALHIRAVCATPLVRFAGAGSLSNSSSAGLTGCRTTPSKAIQSQGSLPASASQERASWKILSTPSGSLSSPESETPSVSILAMLGAQRTRVQSQSCRPACAVL